MELSTVSDPSAAIATTLYNVAKPNGSSASDTESDTESESERDSKCKGDELVEKVIATQDNDATKAKLADQQEFPFLHSLGLCTEKQMDRLVHEVLKFQGNKAVKFK
jgi:hypothetical protein